MSLIKIKTRDFSEVEINEDLILTFPNGIFAFEDEKRFVLLSPLGEDKFPMWLQSIDKQDLCFIVFDPKEFCPDYAVTISDEDKNEIGFEQGHQTEYISIAVIPQEYIDTTINLKSPIVIDNNTKKAIQVIAPESYPLKFSLYKKEEN